MTRKIKKSECCKHPDLPIDGKTEQERPHYSTKTVTESVERVSPKLFVTELTFTPIQKGSVSIFLNDQLLSDDASYAASSPQNFKWTIDYSKGLFTLKFNKDVGKKARVEILYVYELG